MKDPFRFNIEPPKHGWTTVVLKADDVNLQFAPSYTPWDSIGGLVKAVSAVLHGVSELVVSWITEPVEYDFRFTSEGGQTRFEVFEYPDHRRRWRLAEVPVAVVAGETTAVCRAIWRGLRRLQGAQSANEFEAEWRRPFPVDVMQHLSDFFKTRMLDGVAAECHRPKKSKDETID